MKLHRLNLRARLEIPPAACVAFGATVSAKQHKPATPPGPGAEGNWRPPFSPTNPVPILPALPAPDDTAFYADKVVPHGRVEVVNYQTNPVPGKHRHVYLPPGYEADPAARYSVLYLNHGGGANDRHWTAKGFTHLILDNLIAEKRAIPMIIVRPCGNMMMGTPPPTSVQAADIYRVFNDEMVRNVMPIVEANYRVPAGPEKREIAGFSRGGGQSLDTGFNNPDKFAWIG